MSAPVKRRPAVVLSNNSCPSSRESCLARQRDLEKRRAHIVSALERIADQSFEWQFPRPCNGVREISPTRFEISTKLCKAFATLLRAVDKLIAWNTDVMAGKATV